MRYPHNHEDDIIFFARTNFRNRLRKFGIRTDDRRRHMYVIGKSGVGKTTMIENMMLADVYYGHGMGLLDPHGDSAEKMVRSIPDHRVNDVIYFNPSDVDHCIGFNILESVDASQRHLIASGLMGVFKKIWPDVWSARMEHIMNNTLMSLIENPGTTLMGINRVLVDRDYRRKIVGGVKDPVVKAFWVTEFEQWDTKYQTEAVAPIQNKVGQFLSVSIIRNILAQEKSTINVREIMDQNKILIVNLSKGRIGEDASRLLGGLLVTKMQLAAMERVDTEEDQRQDFYLYIDEFQNFATESFANILSEARKYRLCLIMAHQYIEQLDEAVRAGVFGNAGTIVSFRVGAADAPTLALEFAPKFIEDDLVNLPKANIYLKLLCRGISTDPFSATTLWPIQVPVDNEHKVIEASRRQWSVPREIVEKRILDWSESKPVVEEGKSPIPEKAPEKPKKIPPWMHEYTCSRCEKKMQLPVELDRSRPIYCEDCIDIVKEERKKGKKPSGKKDDKKEEKKNELPPKPSEAKIVEKAAPKGEVSLSALGGGGPSATAPTAKKEDVEKAKETSRSESSSSEDRSDKTPQSEGEGGDRPKRKRRRKRKSSSGTSDVPTSPREDRGSSAPTPEKKPESRSEPKEDKEEDFQVVSSKDDIFPW